MITNSKALANAYWSDFMDWAKEDVVIKQYWGGCNTIDGNKGLFISVVG